MPPKKAKLGLPLSRNASSPIWCHTVIIILGMVYRFKFSRCWSNVHFKIILDSSKKCSICLLRGRDWPEGIRSCHIIQPTTRRTRFEAKQSHHTPNYTNNKKWTNFSFVDPFCIKKSKKRRVPVKYHIRWWNVLCPLLFLYYSSNK